jgi:hypothetical protein
MIKASDVLSIRFCFNRNCPSIAIRNGIYCRDCYLALLELGVWQEKNMCVHEWATFSYLMKKCEVCGETKVWCNRE